MGLTVDAKVTQPPSGACEDCGGSGYIVEPSRDADGIPVTAYWPCPCQPDHTHLPIVWPRWA